MMRTIDSVPKGQSVLLTGDVKMSWIMHQIRDQSAEAKEAAAEGLTTTSAYQWEPSHFEAFDRAVERLRIAEACKRNWKAQTLEKCFEMRFRVDSANLDGIEWAR